MLASCGPHAACLPALPQDLLVPVHISTAAADPLPWGSVKEKAERRQRVLLIFLALLQQGSAQLTLSFCL